MPTNTFRLPDVGEGVAEGELVAWLVEPGDRVTEDQPVAEVETDKSIVEIPSPYDGTVEELLVDEGEVVPVGDELLTFAVDEEADAVEEAKEDAEDTDADAESAEAERGTTEEVATPDGRVFAPPRVRRLARELGVDLAAVDGSGASGRITEADVREAAETDEAEEDKGPKPFTPSGKSAVSKDGQSVSGAGLADEAEEAKPKPKPFEPSGKSAVSKGGESVSGAEVAEDDASTDSRERTTAAPATRRLANELGVDIDAVPTDVERDGEPFVTPTDVREYADREQAAAEAAEAAEAARAAESTEAEAAGTRIPYRGIRQSIGEQMVRSKSTIPHVTHHDTAVVSELVDLRAELKPLAEEHGVRLTYLPFVMKAVVRALAEMPLLNSTLDEEGEEIILKDEYHIGVAVATEAGLLVPVVRDVDEKTMLELAEEIVDLAERARNRDLTREEMQGGTFTITNFGAIGGEYATPIINHPETAILGLGAIEHRPVVEDGAVVARETLPLSLSIDHRVIDGAEGATFTNRLIEYLEEPNRLLLEST